jgi:ankyrin repeat protein
VGEVEVLDKLWEWAKGVLIRDEFSNELLLANDDKEISALHHAALSGKIQVIEKILKWTNEQLTKEVLIKLLLAQNNRRQSACHVAKWLGQEEVLNKLWEKATELL